MLTVQIQNRETEVTEWIPAVKEISFGYTIKGPGYWLDGAFIANSEYRILVVRSV